VRWGCPAVRWVSPIIEDLGRISIATFADSAKVRQTRRNPRVVLLFTLLPDGDRSVEIRGCAAVVDEPSEKQRIWKAAPFSLAGFFPGGPGSPEYCVLRLTAETARWRSSWEGETRTLRLA